MRKTLYLKFLGAYLLFGILCVITIGTVTAKLTLEHLTREKANSLYREASLVSQQYATLIMSDRAGVDTARAQLKALDTYISCPIWLMNNSGKVIYSTRQADSESSEIYTDFDPTSSGSYYMTGNFFGAFQEETLSVFSPITSRFRVLGYVVIHSSMKDIIASRNEILNISYVSLGIIMLLSLIIITMFTIIVYIPLNHITKAAEEYAAGNMEYKLESHGRDEMGYLAGTLNYMASEIYRSEENQKKFIANVSHDFRSPLTSIRGYLEAMIDGTIPPEMHEKYLKIVENETERLTKLTNGLLELNSLNSRGMVLEYTDFDINEVIRQTAETFGGTCMEKKISIELILTGETLFVQADVGKIQQVLYNLLDNAIKFSHTNSIVKVETTEKNDKIFVSVKDSGIGIPKDSVKLVFDRFYKTDLSRGKDKKGTGLGLSIVKEIISAHKQNINVVSTEGVGTEFIFTLAESRTEE
ncbi:MAG: HAMP domain-containing protein [Lachnospiraceae bacterium]|nr:HAMP domain-containing protein [Lachnospiraceae bacterium]